MADRREDIMVDAISVSGDPAAAMGAEQPDAVLIRAEIHETRERMSGTLDDIGERLRPERLKQQVKDGIHDATIGRVESAARSARGTIADTIRDNPIPAAMVGVGLGLLFWNGRDRETRERQRSYGGTTGGLRTTYLADSPSARSVYEWDEEPGVMDRARDRAADVKDRAGEKASDLADRAQDAAGRVTDRAQDAAQTVADTARRGAERAEEIFESTPLAMGLATAALGFAAGLAIPETRREHELMGGARDELLDRVKDVAQEKGRQAQRVAERTIDEARSTAKEEARNQGLTSS